MKNQKTQSDHLEWDRFKLLLHQLERDGNIRFLLLFAVGTYTALRISDVLSRKWCDFLEKDYLEVKEKKTGKTRRIHIHPELHEIVLRNYSGQDTGDLMFSGESRSGAMSVQHVNRKLKKIFAHYGIHGRYSTHFFRKTWARRVWAQNGCSEKALLIISEALRHSNLACTRIYLNIRKEEIKEVYLCV